MIDSHCHTFYSKHATGTVDELVCASIEAGVSVLTITDHAPFSVDSENRLLEHELEHYFSDIEKVRQKYKGEIIILRGMELDYMPGTEASSRRLLKNYPMDFVIGSIHYVEVKNEPMVKVWNLARLNRQSFLDSYFDSLASLIESGLFDAVGHIDSILRGVPEEAFLQRISPLVDPFAKSGMAYELNASGLRKTVLNLDSGEEVMGQWSYPSRTLLANLLEMDVPFTIGSDAHCPRDAGAGIAELLMALKPAGLQKISYFQHRQRIDVALDKLRLPAHCIQPQQEAL